MHYRVLTRRLVRFVVGLGLDTHLSSQGPLSGNTNTSTIANLIDFKGRGLGGSQPRASDLAQVHSPSFVRSFVFIGRVAMRVVLNDSLVQTDVSSVSRLG